MSFKRRLAKLERAAQPGAEWEVIWAMSVADFAIWSGAAGLDDYLALLELAGLLWLRDDERIVSWSLDIGDGDQFESQAPIVRRVRYAPRAGWPRTPMMKIWNLSSLPGRPGRHVREFEQPPGDPWPPHWPPPRLPLSPGQEASGE